MKKLLHIVLAIGFCLMFCFLAVGYAALNDELHVTGTVSYEYIPEETVTPGDTVVGGDVELEGGDTLEAGLYIGYGTNRDGNSSAGLNSVRFPMYARTVSEQSAIYYSVIDTSRLNDLSKFLAGDADYVTEVLLCVLPENVTEEPLFLYLDGTDDLDDDGTKDNRWKSERNRPNNIWKNADTKDDGFKLQVNTRYVLYFYGVTKDTNNDDQGKWELVETGSSSNTPETTAFTLDTTAVTNLTIESQEAQTMDLSSRPNLLLTLTPAEGYLLPETFTVTISGTEYAVSTAGENETETMLWEAETNTLYILGDILPTDGSPVIVTAHAVPEIPGFALNTDGLLHLTAEWYTANGCLNLSLTAEDGYLLPESLAVTINDIPYTVYTTLEGEKPAGMGYDPIENILTVHFSLIPQDARITLTAEAITEDEEEETEPAEKPIEPTEEITAPTEESTASTEETTDPTGEAIDPTEETTEPTGEAIDPTEETTEPTGEAIDPTEETTDPSGEATDPTEETTAPTAESTAPTEETTAPTEENSEPTEAATEPAETTTVPTEAPEQPTGEATEPTGESTDSV